MNENQDPGVRFFFLKIINTIAAGLLWLMAAFTGGLYLKLAYIGERPLWAVLIFYVFIITLLVLLIRYYLRMWR